MSTYLERYKNGEYEQVWAELLALGGQIRQEPLFSEALAVARETMGRAKYNVELLYKRLKAINYEFAFPELSLNHPEQDIVVKIERFEKLAGLLPLSVRVWYEIVGAVCFMGVHPKLASYDSPSVYSDPNFYSDPLVISPFNEVFWEYEEWEEMSEEYKSEGFLFEMAPDYFHKEAVSGGGPYGVSLPNPAIDATFEDEWHNTTFVNYLRICFKWGGYPGFERSNYHPEELTFLAEGLLPI